MNRAHRRRRTRAQQGVILFIALIVLVAMSLAGIALMRSVDTNVLIAGNLAFRQARPPRRRLGRRGGARLDLTEHACSATIRPRWSTCPRLPTGRTGRPGLDLVRPHPEHR